MSNDYKEVCIEITGQETVRQAFGQTETNKKTASWLMEAFTKAVGNPETPSAKMNCTKDRIEFSVDYDDFKKLYAGGAFTLAVDSAFLDSDARLTANNAKERGFLSKAWDAWRYHDVIMSGKPVAYYPTSVSGSNNIQVTIKQYGIS